MGGSSSIQSDLLQNRTVMISIPNEMLYIEWATRTQGETLAKAKTAAGYVAPSMDAVLIAKIIKDLGITGRAIPQVLPDGTRVITIRAAKGARETLKLFRYAPKSPALVEMGIGRAGVKASVRSGARLTFVLFVAVNLLTYILDDEATMGQLLGTTATDLIKVGASAGVSAATGVAVGAVTTVAAGPLIVALAVGVAFGLALDFLDEKFGITAALSAAIDSYLSKIEANLRNTTYEVKRQYWDAERAMRSGTWLPFIGRIR